MEMKKTLLQTLLLASLITLLASGYQATAERLTFADTAHNIVIVFYIAIVSALIAGIALFLGETPITWADHREVPMASDEKGEKIFAAILTALGVAGGIWVYIRMANAPSNVTHNLTESAGVLGYQMVTLLGGGVSAILLVIGLMRLLPRLIKADTGWILGALLGGFIAYLMRPSLPLIGQLPFEIVITAGTQLKGLDTMLVGAARESCLILVVGVILGAVVGTIIGPILLKLNEAVSSTAPVAPPANEHTRTCPFCAETIKIAAKVCRFCGRELQAGTMEKAP